MEEKDYEPEQEYVGSYADQHRVGGKRLMLTEIEGNNKLAFIQKKREKIDPETRMYDSLENLFYILYKDLQLAEVDLVTLIDLIQKCPNRLYKNIFTFIIAYGYLNNKLLSLDRLVKFAQFHEHPDCNEVAIVRYSRLIKSLQ